MTRAVTLPAPALAWLIELASLGELDESDLVLLDKLEAPIEELGSVRSLRERSAEALATCPAELAYIPGVEFDRQRLLFIQETLQGLRAGRIELTQAVVELDWLNSLIERLLDET